MKTAVENLATNLLAICMSAVVFVSIGATPTEPVAAREREAKKELVLDPGGKLTLKLVRIPAGKFLMGSPQTEKDRNSDETQHEVTISKPFYMGATHVTWDQFESFVKESGYRTDAEKAGASLGFEIKDRALDLKTITGRHWRNPSFEQKGNHPVVQISWNDAKAFCNWLSKKTSKTVTLPTEAQWEYACRAGAKTTYPWGDDPDEGKGWANCADQSLKKRFPNLPNDWSYFSWDDGFVFTSPVGSFKPNAFGLYDMTGNAWQWCSDRHGPYDTGAVTDPTGATTGNLRVLRGGSWIIFPKFCRAATRFKDEADVRDVDDGFRVVVQPGPGD